VKKRTPRHKHKSFDKKKRDSTNLVVFLYYYHILFICLYTMRQPKIAHHNPNVFNKNIHIELTSFVYVFKSTRQMAFRWLDFLTSKKNRNSMTWPFFWSYHMCVTSITAHASGASHTNMNIAYAECLWNVNYRGQSIFLHVKFVCFLLFLEYILFYRPMFQLDSSSPITYLYIIITRPI
jgi:hypothetical protein